MQMPAVLGVVGSSFPGRGHRRDSGHRGTASRHGHHDSIRARRTRRLSFETTRSWR